MKSDKQVPLATALGLTPYVGFVSCHITLTACYDPCNYLLHVVLMPISTAEIGIRFK